MESGQAKQAAAMSTSPGATSQRAGCEYVAIRGASRLKESVNNGKSGRTGTIPTVSQIA